MAKTTKEVKKEEIKIKQVAKNYIVIIDGKKYTLVAPTKKVAEGLTTKILIFNKRNSGVKKQEILDIVDTKTKKEEVLKTKIKGITNNLKKERKIISKTKGSKIAKVVKSVEESKVDLITKVETAFNNKELSAEEIQRLEDLLKEKKQAIAEKKEPQATQGEDYGSGRERYR